MYTDLNHKSEDLSVQQFCLLAFSCAFKRLLSLTTSSKVKPLRDDVTLKQITSAEAKTNDRYLNAILIGLLSLSTLFVLNILRAYDDNRLISWQWVFANNEIFVTSLILLTGLLLSWWLTCIQLSQKKTLTLLLFSSFLISAFQWSHPELIVDASRYFLQAKSLSDNGPGYFINEWGYGIAAWTDLPLIPFLYGTVFALVGEHRIAIQVLTSLFFCGTVLLTYLLGSELWDKTTGLYGAALLLGMPYLLSQIPLMLVDIPSMFFLCLAVYITLIAVMKESQPWFVMSLISIILALLCKYSTWLMLSVLAVVAVSYRSGSWTNLCKQMLYLLFAISIFFSALLLWKYDAVVKQFALLMTYQLPALSRWHESHLSTFFYQVHPFITLGAISSVYFAWRKRDVRYLIISWMLLLVLLLEIKRIRYALIVFPMLALMAAYALQQIRDTRIRSFMLLSIIVSSLAVGLYGYSSFAHKTSAMNIKQAGEFLNKINASTVEIILLPQTHSSINPFVSVPLLDLFTKKNIVYWKPAYAMSQSQKKNSATSSLRFSWDYQLENYYKTSGETVASVIVIISDTRSAILPAIISERLKGFHLKRRFTHHEGVYRYSTIVDVYEANEPRKSVEFIEG